MKNSPEARQLTLFPAGSLDHASHLVQPGSARERKMTVISGRRCYELYKKQSQLGSLVKTLLESSTWNSNKCVLTWKPKVMKSSRLLYQLVPSMPRIEGIEYGLLHTIKANETCENPVVFNKRMKDRTDKCFGSLSAQIKYGMLPTPVSRDYKGNSKHTEAKGRNPMTNSLPDAIQHGTKTGLKLQPAFVEWMQGYPIGWTDLYV